MGLWVERGLRLKGQRVRAFGFKGTLTFVIISKVFQSLSKSLETCEMFKSKVLHLYHTFSMYRDGHLSSMKFGLWLGLRPLSITMVQSQNVLGHCGQNWTSAVDLDYNVTKSLKTWEMVKSIVLHPFV